MNAGNFCSVHRQRASASPRGDFIDAIALDGDDPEVGSFGSRRGRADRAFAPSGLAKILGDAGAVLSRHWLAFDNRLSQPNKDRGFLPNLQHALGYLASGLSVVHLFTGT
jgi:hypothetical protein